MTQNLFISDRKMVLAHHPDKKSHKSTKTVIPGLNEHEYFTCITKAYEVLSNITSRRAYDSVHSSFDDAVPTQVKGDFFETFRLPFKRNARFATFLCFLFCFTFCSFYLSYTVVTSCLHRGTWLILILLFVILYSSLSSN